MLFFISIIVIILSEIQSQWSFYGNNRIECYACSDCPEPFFRFHTQVIITPRDIGQCMKTVVYLPNSGRYLVSKGFSRNCIPELSGNVRVYCCYYNLCNGSNALLSSVTVTIISFLMTFFVYSALIR